MKGAKVAAGLFFLVGFMCFVGAAFIVMNRESSGASEALAKAEAVNQRIDKIEKSFKTLENDLTTWSMFCGGVNQRGKETDDKVTKTQAKVEWMEMKLNNQVFKKPIPVTIISTPGSRKAAKVQDTLKVKQ